MTGSASSSLELPSALDQAEAIRSRLHNRQAIVFTDYDGTLTPIVAKPELAVLDPKMRNTITSLARHCPVGIISGRALADIQHLVDLDNVYYAGNHGLQLVGPSGSGLNATRGEEFIAELAEVKAQLGEALAPISGVLIEDKQLSLSVHYRLAKDEEIAFIEQAVDQILSPHDQLRKHLGKKVFEVRPAINWHKGYVVNWLLEMLAQDNALPFYLGDDVTDEDAFQAIAGTGIGIRIGSRMAQSHAHYSLDNPREVQHFLDWLSQQLQRSP